MNRRKFLGMLGLGAAVGLVAKSTPSPPVNRMPYFVGTKGRVYFEPAIGPYRAINTVYYPALAAHAQAFNDDNLDLGRRVALFINGKPYAFNAGRVTK